MTVQDILKTPRFRDNLAAYMEAQRIDREGVRKSYQAMLKLGGARGYKLPAHVIDRVINMPVEAFAAEYAKILCGGSERSAAERKYILQLGQQAYSLTVAQYIVDEYPELESELIPKQNNPYEIH